ncbi:MAG: tyrosine-type recombinase/integrase [Candidatus Wallbacteria bacterium]|nr:tyrosine-type recombinase/integrase [Candidatus Wallbacteria bacterium]
MAVYRDKRANWKMEVYHQGKRVAYETFPPDQEKLARKTEEAVKVDVLRGVYNLKPKETTPRRTVTFRELATRFLAWVELNERPGTFRYYAYRLKRHIVPALGQFDIAELRRKDIIAYLEARQTDGMSKSSFRKELQIIRRLLAWGVEREADEEHPALEVNVAVDIRRPRAPRNEEPRFYSPEEVYDQILASLRNPKLENLKLEHPTALLPDTLAARVAALKDIPLGLMLTAFTTGMRLRELQAFSFDWCDFQRGIIRIPNTLEFSPKGHKPRTVVLNEDLKLWLLTRTRKVGRVFVSPKYRRPIADFRKTLLAVEKATGFHIKLHDARHTFASFLLAEGVPLHEVKEILGHTDISTTMIYAHLVPEHLEKVRAALARRQNRRGLQVVK